MNKYCLNPLFCGLLLALAGCTPPQKDIPVLTAEIDAVVAGHYGQSIYHEEMAEESLEDANRILHHWQKDHYWNIEEGQRAVDAARNAAKHRFESEKALCRWLTAVHSANHGLNQIAHHSAAYFKTGSAEPYQINSSQISALANYLRTHPEAKADITAYTDSVGSAESNNVLAQRRAATIQQLLIDQGAKSEQLSIIAAGEAEGLDNLPNQHHRVVIISTFHSNYSDCTGLQ